ncbi:hypothetical protein WA026_018496 [Henosepilachna vigintioctopunctata]|uniref:Ionotropic receptor n=1 Tax=Henosepilachna vigintioctopunctata TaxID=420089 RepID=A0AAW1V406_9CUCU
MKISHLMVNFTVTQCVNFILNKNTSPTDFIIVTSNSIDILPNWPVARLEKRKPFSIPLGLKPDILIFDNATMHEIKNVFNTLITWQGYNASAKYIFIVDVLYGTLIDFVASKYLVNTIFITIITRKIFTIAPYEEYDVEEVQYNNSKHYSKLLIRLGSCDDQTSLQQHFFPSKKNRNWMNQTITLVYVSRDLYSLCDECKNPGISIEIITSILKHLNIPYILLRGFFFNFEKLIERFDFIATALILSPTKMFEYTTPYTDDVVYFYLARPAQIDRWRYILLVFSPSAWMYFSLSLLAAVSVFMVMKFLNERIRNIGIIQFIFIIFLGRIKRYRTKVVSLEILVFCMVFLSVMLNYLFCSKLTYLLNGITFEKGVESFEDVAKQGFTIGVSDLRYMDWVKRMSEFRHYTDENFVLCTKDFLCDFAAKRNRNLAFLASRRSMSGFQREYKDQYTGIPHLKFLKRPFTMVQ